MTKHDDVLRQASPGAVAVSHDLARAMTSGGNRNGMSGTGDQLKPQAGSVKFHAHHVCADCTKKLQAGTGPANKS